MLHSDDLNILAETREACRRMAKINDNYFSKNIPLQWIFWKRLQIILDMAKRVRNPESVLDFGMGWGVLLPSLSKIFQRVYGVDIHEPSIAIARHLIQLLDCRNVQVLQAQSDDRLPKFGRRSLNCIIAADVLEHVRNLSNVLSSFDEMLADDGYLIVSIPTENRIYSMAKMLLKHPASVDRHIHNRMEVIREVKQNFTVRERRSLLFFEIFRTERVNI